MIRALYVDDEEALLDLAKVFLEQSNDILVRTTSNAQAGLDIVLEGKIDVVVSDYMMPDMDGLAFLRALREAGNDIPFILFTGRGREEVVIQALNEGADSYLQKGGQPRPQFAELAHRIIRAVERRQAVLALQQSEGRLKRAEEIAGFGHWELHLDNGMMVSSSGARIIYGMPESEKEFEMVKTVPLPEYRPMLDNALKNLVENGSMYDLEFKIRRPSDGKIVDIHSRAEYDPVNRVIFGVLQDITERKRAEFEIGQKTDELRVSYAQISAAEEGLKAAKHQLAVAMDLAKVVHWDLDMLKGTFIFNDQFYALYGTSAAREGGYNMTAQRYVDIFVHPDDRAHVTNVIESNLRSKIGIKQLEHQILTGDGQVRDIVVCIEVETDRNGIPFHAYGANQDITDRKRAEQALERANRKLSLLNTITRHDITNQISILRGNLGLVIGSIDDPEVRKRLENVDASSQIILDQIRFTKEYQDMGSSAPLWQSISSIINGSLLVHEVKDLLLGEDAAGLSIYADPMLPKVFNNLMENTLRYGSRPATVRITSRPDEGSMVLVYEDIGPGIPSHEKEKIFEKGFGKGTGLGLFLSREILAITGIAISETGEPGQGARFEISIPRQMIRVKDPKI